MDEKFLTEIQDNLKSIMGALCDVQLKMFDKAKCTNDNMYIHDGICNAKELITSLVYKIDLRKTNN